jgi:serine/threonine protein kinase
MVQRHPVILRPEGGSRIIAIGTTGIICQNACLPDQVIKAPLRHDICGCDEDVIKTILHDEEYAMSCFERERTIYAQFPKNINILDCIAIEDGRLHFPFLRLGNLRDYLASHNEIIGSQLRDQWIDAAIDAIALLHRFEIVHADISTRNFLVADDLSIRLCDFSGSSMGNQPSLVEEEDRYRISPNAPRSIATDIFALGCLIFEIMTGNRPYDEIPDDACEEIERRYAIGAFPLLKENVYEKIILKCWTLQYVDVKQVKQDMKTLREEKISHSHTEMTVTSYLLTVTPVILLISGIILVSRRKLWDLWHVTS